MIECKRGEEVWHTYTYLRDGAPFGYAKWRKVQDAAELHNEMYQTSKSALKLSRHLFQEIMKDMAQAGCTHVVVADTNENVTEARLKYWRFMGFDLGGCALGYTFAVQGVTCQ